jgi:hypothetical protein
VSDEISGGGKEDAKLLVLSIWLSNELIFIGARRQTIAYCDGVASPTLMASTPAMVGLQVLWHVLPMVVTLEAGATPEQAPVWRKAEAHI